MSRPIILELGLCLILLPGPFDGVAMARGGSAEAAIKEAESRLRGSAPVSALKKKAVSAPVEAPAPENFFTKLASAFTRPTAAPRVAAKADAPDELPEVTVRGTQSFRRESFRSSGADLRKLVSGIVMRLGPMQLEESDDAVMNPSADSLSLLAHPNIQPVVPVAPVPVPGSGRGGKPEYAPNPLTEHRRSWLAAKVAEKLGGMEKGQVVSAPPEKERVEEPKGAPSNVGPDRESIELLALLAVSGEGNGAKGRTDAEVRVSALSLLAGAPAASGPERDAGSRTRPAELKEQPLPSQQPLPVPAIKPAREIDPAGRTKILLLLQPEKLAGAP